jgi:hypothetical protein
MSLTLVVVMLVLITLYVRLTMAASTGKSRSLP